MVKKAIERLMPKGSKSKRLERIAVPIKVPELPNLQIENLWGERIHDGEYILRNSPFFADGLAAEDLVKATRSSGALKLQRVLKQGGHSNYRVYLDDRVTLRSKVFS